VPLGVPSCAPSPAQPAWAPMRAVPTSSSSSPILTEKGSTAEKRRLRARRPETGRPGPEPRGRVWTDVDGCGCHLASVGEAFRLNRAQSSGTTSAERRELGPGPCPPPGASPSSDQPRPRLRPSAPPVLARRTAGCGQPQRVTHIAGLRGWQSLEQRQAGCAPPSARSEPQLISSPGPGRAQGSPPTAVQRNQVSQLSLSRQAHWEPFATTPWEPSPGTIVPWSHGSFSWGLLPGQLPLFLQPGRGWGSRVARCGLRSGREPGRQQGSVGVRSQKQSGRALTWGHSWRSEEEVGGYTHNPLYFGGSP